MEVIFIGQDQKKHIKTNYLYTSILKKGQAAILHLGLYDNGGRNYLVAFQGGYWEQQFGIVADVMGYIDIPGCTNGSCRS